MSSSAQITEPIPSVAYELGGSPLAVYKASYARQFLTATLALGFGALLVFGALAAMGEPDSGGIIIAIPLGLLLVGWGFWFIFKAIRERDLRVIVMNDGFVLIRGGSHQVFRWADIANVWQAVTVHRSYGVKTGTTHRYTIQLKNGTKTVLTDTLRNVEALGNNIQEQVTKRILPQAVEALNAGQSIKFGKIQVTPHGLGNGKELVPWNEIKGVSVNMGYISVQKQGKILNWARTSVAQTPNVLVFLSLVDHVVGIKTR
jgi:hypothetical protein